MLFSLEAEICTSEQLLRDLVESEGNQARVWSKVKFKFRGLIPVGALEHGYLKSGLLAVGKGGTQITRHPVAQA